MTQADVERGNKIIVDVIQAGGTIDDAEAALLRAGIVEPEANEAANHAVSVMTRFHDKLQARLKRHQERMSTLRSWNADYGRW